MKIIPAIDIIDGKCVRLTKGDYDRKKVYNENPLEVAKMFEDAGVRFLHLVDLDGAKARKIINLDVLESITSGTSLTVDFGGGIQSDEDLRKALDHGASQVTGGSIAVREPETFKRWLNNFGADKIILGADALNGKIATSGWQEISEIDLNVFIKTYLEHGVKRVICTDISKDGVLQGPSFDLYKGLLKEFPDLELVASGGVTTLDDLKKLRDHGLYGAIVGKALYENRITLDSLKELL